MLTMLIAYASQHPMVVNLAWVIVTAFLTAVLKPRSDAEYAASKYPRLMAVLKLLSALGLDPVKAVEALKQIVSGRVAPALAPPTTLNIQVSSEKSPEEIAKSTAAIIGDLINNKSKEEPK